MPAPELLMRLLSAPGPSGHESVPARVWREHCSSFATEVGGDQVGSSFARVAGTGGGPSVAVVGHIDEIGLHVSHIDDDGYLRFGQVGGWDPGVLIGQRVRLRTRDGDVPGVIGYLGTVLGKNGVNIANFALGREDVPVMQVAVQDDPLLLGREQLRED